LGELEASYTSAATIFQLFSDGNNTSTCYESRTLLVFAETRQVASFGTILLVRFCFAFCGCGGSNPEYDRHR
jgi:hypothetical protein